VVAVTAFCVAALWLAAAAPPARAGSKGPCPTFPGMTTLVACFDDEPSGGAASAASIDHVVVLDALILSEADAGFLLGLDTAGWATSGNQGILNSLVPAVDFLFDGPITLFRLSVVALPGPAGAPVPVVVQGFAGAELRASDLSDVARVRADGTHDDSIKIEDLALGFDRVRVFAALGPCGGDDCEIGGTTSFFADTVQFVVPEPSSSLLVVASFCALRGLGRERHSRIRKETSA